MNAGRTLAQNPAALTREIERNRVQLRGLAKSPLVDSEVPRLETLLTDVEGLIKAGRLAAALEWLGSVSPGTVAVAKAGEGWAESATGPGKKIEALEADWIAIGKAIARERPRFPTGRSDKQSAFLRAVAEIAIGQIDENYAVAVSYGRESGLPAGAYYAGRAQGLMAFSIVASSFTSSETRKDRIPVSLEKPLLALDDAIVMAYAKPGSTAQHGNFITANSMLKLARELDQQGLRYGALLTLMRSAFALALATIAPPDPSTGKNIAMALDELEKRFKDSAFDESIGDSYIEKARISLEKADAGGETGDRERLRAHAIATVVLPRYMELTGGGK